MSLFSGKEKKSCSCGVHTDATAAKGKGAAVKILGGGCAKCNQLESNALEALKQLGLDTEIDHVRDYAEIARYGVMTTPALVYNGKVLCYGKVLKTGEIVALLQKEG